MADIGEPEREIEVRPRVLPLPTEEPVPAPVEPRPVEEPVPA
ncbi:MAG TPA: hypothetical protein VK631_14990 [Solirubrobacteraceae bacterium]|nr:hypothetical protein [Solirubrobacteraceae bacterium]